MSQPTYFDAIRTGDGATLRALIRESPELLSARTTPPGISADNGHCTGLHTAIYARKAEIARALIDAGIDIVARTAGGRTALHDSIEFGLDEITRLLLERGAYVDICSAAILGRRDRVRELLDGDASLANDRSTGLSPLGWAAYGNQCETATELIERGARMDDGELLCAAAVGHVQVGRLLLERGADPNEPHPGAGGNALHAAASMRYTHDSTRFVRLLLDHGADATLCSRSGKTAYEIAADGAARQQREPGQPPEHAKAYAAVAALLREHLARGD